ncbi:MAG: ABC transporter ATP-binding protein [Ruminococcus sp.]|nr:ABC transporter ATP-binding protein [Ruminococcus sp.]
MSIEIKNVCKNYKQTTALDNINLTIDNNKIYGLFGRNGVGKTTLLNIINNRIFPTSGEILIDGENVKKSSKALSKIYMMSEINLFPKEMKIKTLFKWIKSFNSEFDINKANSLLTCYKISDNIKIRGLSTGQSTILKLIVGLCINKPYLIFDEPVNGLDANHREQFYRHLLEKYIEDPCTIIVSTHLIDEIANIVEEVIIIDNGKIVVQKSKDEFLSEGFAISGKSDIVDEFAKNYEIIDCEQFGMTKTIYVIGDIPDLIPNEIEISQLNLQKLFIKLTNQREG